MDDLRRKTILETIKSVIRQSFLVTKRKTGLIGFTDDLSKLEVINESENADTHSTFSSSSS